MLKLFRRERLLFKLKKRQKVFQFCNSHELFIFLRILNKQTPSNYYANYKVFSTLFRNFRYIFPIIKKIKLKKKDFFYKQEANTYSPFVWTKQSITFFKLFSLKKDKKVSIWRKANFSFFLKKLRRKKQIRLLRRAKKKMKFPPFKSISTAIGAKKKIKTFFFIREKFKTNIPSKINRRIWSDKIFKINRARNNINYHPLALVFKNYRKFFLKGIRRRSEFFYSKILTIQTRIRKIFQKFYNLLTLRNFFSIFRTKSDLRFAKLGIIPEEKFIGGLDLQIIHIISKLNIFNIKPNIFYQIKSGHIFINNLVATNPYTMLKVGDSFHISLFYYFFMYLARQYTKRFYKRNALPLLTYFKQNRLTPRNILLHKLTNSRLVVNSAFFEFTSQNSVNKMNSLALQLVKPQRKIKIIHNYKYIYSKKFNKMIKIKLAQKQLRMPLKGKYLRKKQNRLKKYLLLKKNKKLKRLQFVPKKKISLNTAQKTTIRRVKYHLFNNRNKHLLKNLKTNTYFKNIVRKNMIYFKPKIHFVKKKRKSILIKKAYISNSAFSILRKRQYRVSTPRFARRYRQKLPYKLFIRKIFKFNKRRHQKKSRFFFIFKKNKKIAARLKKKKLIKNLYSKIVKFNLRKKSRIFFDRLTPAVNEELVESRKKKDDFFNFGGSSVTKKRKKNSTLLKIKRRYRRRHKKFYFKNQFKRDTFFAANLFSYRKMNIVLKLKTLNLIPSFFEFSYKTFFGILFRKPVFFDFYFSRALLKRKKQRLKVLLKFLLHFFSKLKIINLKLLKQTQAINRKIMTFNFIFSRFFSEFQYRLPWF